MTAPRRARLVLVDAAGRVLGALPPFEVEPPWWQEVAAVVAGARARYAIEITVLRLLEAQRPRPPGGDVTYLAQVAAAPSTPALTPLGRESATALQPHDRRAAYAEVGGPDADLAWARGALAAVGRELVAATQIRTWNLSSIWRLELADNSLAWLKVVPAFMLTEGALLLALDPAPVAGVVAHDARRTLLEHVPGEDLYEASLAARVAMVEKLVALQAREATRLEPLLALGVPDWRAPRLAAAIEGVVRRVGGELDAAALVGLRRWVAGIPDRFEQLAACGIPDTLVHGDFHGGNVRGASDTTELTLVDFADAAIGHPLLDAWVLINTSPEHMRVGVTSAFARAWRERLPDSDPARALALLEPLGHLRQAAVYLQMLDAIEPSERPYHADDPLICLQRAVRVIERAAE